MKIQKFNETFETQLYKNYVTVTGEEWSDNQIFILHVVKNIDNDLHYNSYIYLKDGKKVDSGDKSSISRYPIDGLIILNQFDTEEEALEDLLRNSDKYQEDIVIHLQTKKYNI